VSFRRRFDRAPVPAYGSLRILVAEDNPVNNGSASACREPRHRRGRGRNGSKQRILEGNVRLALFDIQMPEMDGIEAPV